MEARIEACVRIAREAALVASRCGTEARWKGASDPVTEADGASEDFIRREILELFPNDGMVGEEGTSIPGSSGFRWLADPLDGTWNFARGLYPWVVSLAALEGRTVFAGAVVEGTSEQVFAAAAGRGAFRNGNPIHSSGTTEPRKALAAFDCPYDMTARMGTTYSAIGEMLRHSAALRCYGSCAAAMCLVASGELDVYFVEHGKPWDFAAGALLVREAGGLVTTWSGGDYHPESNVQVLATNGPLHGAAVELLRPFARE